MAKFFDPENVGAAKLHAPATDRNREHILDKLTAANLGTGTLVEVASGTGQHAAYLAPRLPHITWQPTDIDPDKLASIDDWASETGGENILPARHFDVGAHDWGDLTDAQGLSAVLAINLIHIAPSRVMESLVSGAATILQPGAQLITYGPYRVGGAHTSQSNHAFDQSLKTSNPEWGVRDMEVLAELTADHGFKAPDVHRMPANNFMLFFEKA